MTRIIDNTEPDGQWEFNGEVAEAFGNMLERSIPQYHAMRYATEAVASYKVQPNTDVVDLGCSRGYALQNLQESLGSANRFVGVETSEAFLEICRDKFKDQIDRGWVSIRGLDLRRGYPQDVNASVTLAVLTLQFIPIEYRARILSDIYRTTTDDGCVIVVEKIVGDGIASDTMLTDIYYDLKKENGYSEESIARKRLSLEGVLVPVTAKWNEDLLRQAGFQEVECIWRWMNFAGWVGGKRG